MQVFLASQVSIVKEDEGSLLELLIIRAGPHKVGCPVEATLFF